MTLADNVRSPQAMLMVAEAAAKAAGEILIRLQGSVAVREKGPQDLVTEADLAAQRAIETIIRSQFPNDYILGEESTAAELAAQATSSVRWIIDPLDGTTNFVHGLPPFAVSIAIEVDGVIIAGVVYDPVGKETFKAIKGSGAFCNDRPIQVSRCARLADALVAVGFGASQKRRSPEVMRFEEVLYRAQAVRRLGSAALNLCYVACGRIDSYFATSVKIWDIGAAALFVQEAGGVLSGLNGGPHDPSTNQIVASASTTLHTDLLNTLALVPG